MLPLASQVVSCCPATEKPELACAQSSSAKTAVRIVRSKDGRSLKTMMIYLIHLKKWKGKSVKWNIHCSPAGIWQTSQPNFTNMLGTSLLDAEILGVTSVLLPQWSAGAVHHSTRSPEGGGGWGHREGKLYALPEGSHASLGSISLLPQRNVLEHIS